jgi:hypothetical protein
MSTPLIFKALLMIALGLRLFKSATKEKQKKGSAPLIDFNDLPAGQLAEEINLQDLKNSFKSIYRTNVRDSPYTSKFNYIIFIGYQLDKSLEKGGGIFRFLWYNPEKSCSFLQILEFLNLDVQKQNMSKILKSISFEKFTLFQNKHFSQLNSQSFMPSGDMGEEFCKDFDKSFSMELYWSAAEKYFNSN